MLRISLYGLGNQYIYVRLQIKYLSIAQLHLDENSKFGRNFGQNWWFWMDEKWHFGQHISFVPNNHQRLKTTQNRKWNPLLPTVPGHHHRQLAAISCSAYQLTLELWSSSSSGTPVHCGSYICNEHTTTCDYWAASEPAAANKSKKQRLK